LLHQADFPPELENAYFPFSDGTAYDNRQREAIRQFTEAVPEKWDSGW
jgi:hypothetical protein